MVNLLLKRNNLEPDYPGNAIIVMEGPEPSTSTVLSIAAGDYQYKLLTGLELDRWYHFYAKGPPDEAGHYNFLVSTRNDLPGAPNPNNPVIYEFWKATKFGWREPFDIERIPNGGPWSIGSAAYVPAGKTWYVASIWVTSPENMTQPPEPNPHDLPQRPPICEGSPLKIDLGSGNYFCPSTELLLIVGGIVVTVILVGGYILFG
jgi:hypothetical protein